MGDPLQKVQAGQKRVLRADTWNQVLDATAYVRRLRRFSVEGGNDPRRFSSGDTVTVQNNSSADLDVGQVLGIDKALFAPADSASADDKNAFRDSAIVRVLLAGITPAPGTHNGKYVVTAEPIKIGDVGLAFVSGVCPVRLEVSSAADRFAEIKASTTALKSGPTGSARILFKESGTGLGTDGKGLVAYVRLNDPNDFAMVKISGAIAPGIYIGAVIQLSTDAIISSSMAGFDDSTIGSVSSQLVTVFNQQERNDGTFSSLVSLAAGTPRAHIFPAIRLPKLDNAFTPPRECYAISAIDLGTSSSET